MSYEPSSQEQRLPLLTHLPSCLRRFARQTRRTNPQHLPNRRGRSPPPAQGDNFSMWRPYISGMIRSTRTSVKYIHTYIHVYIYNYIYPSMQFAHTHTIMSHGDGHNRTELRTATMIARANHLLILGSLKARSREAGLALVVLRLLVPLPLHRLACWRSSRTNSPAGTAPLPHRAIQETSMKRT